MSYQRGTHARGFSMIEVVMATATVGVMTVAALSVASSAATERRVASSLVRGQPLAHAMLDEIAALSTEPAGAGSVEPASTTSGFSSLLSGLFSGGGGGGGGTAETADATDVTANIDENRLLYNSLQSYDGWSSTPPKQPDGTPIEGADGLTRSVTVTEVSPTDPTGEEAAGTGLFRVEVTVSRGPRTIGTAVMLRSQRFDGIAR